MSVNTDRSPRSLAWARRELSRYTEMVNKLDQQEQREYEERERAKPCLVNALNKFSGLLDRLSKLVGRPTDNVKAIDTTLAADRSTFSIVLTLDNGEKTSFSMPYEARKHGNFLRYLTRTGNLFKAVRASEIEAPAPRPVPRAPWALGCCYKLFWLAWRADHAGNAKLPDEDYVVLLRAFLSAAQSAPWGAGCRGDPQ